MQSSVMQQYTSHKKCPVAAQLFRFSGYVTNKKFKYSIIEIGRISKFIAPYKTLISHRVHA